jgi:hypothetical protein
MSSGPPGSKLIVYELPRPGLHRLAPANRGRESKKAVPSKEQKGSCGEDTRSAALSQPQADKAVRSIRHQIVVVAQSVLDVERRASRCVGISSARGQHTQGPIILSALIRDEIYRDIQNAWTAKLLPDFR